MELTFHKYHINHQHVFYTVLTIWNDQQTKDFEYTEYNIACFIINFLEKKFRNIQFGCRSGPTKQRFVGPDLVPNCLQVRVVE